MSEPLRSGSSRRPLSPHLQIYKPQLTSLLSILHRFTGLSLGLGLATLTLWVYGAAFEPTWASSFVAVLQTLWGKGLLGGFLFAFWYHFSNGIRHLVWDTGAGLDLPYAYASGYAVVTASLTLAGLTWFLVFS